MKKQKHTLQEKLGPSLGISVRNWSKMVISNRSFSLRYFPRIFLVDFFSSIGIPFRVYERWRYDRLINKIQITKDPIFILGHWRSGTTHLHNLLCQDPQFGFVTMLEALFPNAFLGNALFKSFMRLFLPNTRPMDNMEMGIDKAQEEEMALSNLFPYTFYNGFYFPKKLREFYYKYIRFENLPKKVQEKWIDIYNYLLRKTTWNMHGKQLILKNPANTGRIKFLLKMFPNAKFVHIYRNPYVVFASTKRFYQKTVDAFKLQRVSDEEIEGDILWIYKNMMKTYFKEREMIPKGNLIEIKFEDLEAQPLVELEKIYKQLKIDGFNKAIPSFCSYLDGLHNYRKNLYRFPQKMIEKVKSYWKFAIDKWRYDLPEDE